MLTALGLLGIGLMMIPTPSAQPVREHKASTQPVAAATRIAQAPVAPPVARAAADQHQVPTAVDAPDDGARDYLARNPPVVPVAGVEPATE